MYQGNKPSAPFPFCSVLTMTLRLLLAFKEAFIHSSFFILVSFHLKKFQNKVHFDEKFFLKKYFFVLCLLSLSNVYIAFRIFSTRGRGSQKWPKSFLHRKSMPPWLISFLWQLFERFYLLPLGILDILLGNFVDTCIGP